MPAPVQPNAGDDGQQPETPGGGGAAPHTGGVGGTGFQQREGVAGDATHVPTGGSAAARAGTGGDVSAIPTPQQCASSSEPLVSRDGEVCYELLTHNGGGPGDPFIVPTGESFDQLHYEIPWPEDSVATRFGGIYDNVAVLHKWLAYDLVHAPAQEVQHSTSGTVLFQEATMFAAWTKGECAIELPSDMGIQLAGPSSGKKLMIQWHHTNYTGVPQPDESVVQICTVPRSERAHVGGITWLGTESIYGIAPNQESKASGACLNDTSEPITIVALQPHMHLLGTRAYTELIRVDGTVDAIFDQPFQEESTNPNVLEPFAVMQPGDRIRTECTYFNHTSTPVAFGSSRHDEVCVQHAYAYPVGALDMPGIASLHGALNTCWGG
jgi:hypothetical protein